jgi:hypothetical protein
MKTMTLHVTSGKDGLLRVEIPAPPNQAFDLVLVMQPAENEAVDDLGWPVGFFEETYGSLTDDPIDRGPELPLPIRDEIE